MKQTICDKCHKVLVKHYNSKPLCFKLEQTNPWVNVPNQKFHLCENCYDRFCDFLNDERVEKE